MNNILFPYQSDILRDEYDVVLVEKSRQIGVTWSIALRAVYVALMGATVNYVGYNLSMATTFISDCAHWLDALNLGMHQIGMGNEVYRDGSRSESVFRLKIEVSGGGSIAALASQPRNVRSRRGYVIIDEAAFHKDLTGIREAAAAVKRWGGTLTVISTHYGIGNEFYGWTEEIRSGKVPGRIHTIPFETALQQGFYERNCAIRGVTYKPENEAKWVKAIYDEYSDDEIAREELDVIPSKGRGGYIPVNMIERAMIRGREVVRLSLKSEFSELGSLLREQDVAVWYYDQVRPALRRMMAELNGSNSRIYLGVDCARSGDKTVFAPLIEAEDITYHCPLLVELHDVPFESQWLALDMLTDDLGAIERACIDASGNGAYLAEKAQQKLGARLDPVQSSNAHYTDNMPRFKSAFLEHEITVPRHTDVLLDLRSITIDKGVPKVPSKGTRKGTDGLQRHGDAAMALYMAHCATKSGHFDYSTMERKAERRLGTRQRGSIWS